MSAGPRHLAIEILCCWEKSGRPIDRVFAEQLQQAPLADYRDVNLATAIVYGILRRLSYLDWILKDFSSLPLAKMKARTLQALRVGLYQLLFLDRVPAAAAINETVQALKTARQPKWLTSYVNGILRAVSRRQQLPGPWPTAEEMPEPARLGHPEWLFARWRERYGQARAVKICQANNSIPSLCLRVNTRKIPAADFVDVLQRKNLAAEAGSFSPAAVLLGGYRGRISEIPGYIEGHFAIQDEAAQLVSLLLSPLQPGRPYLDGCAGVGGKTGHLAQLLPEKHSAAENSRITAVEPSPARVRLLRENLHRLRLSDQVEIIEGELDKLGPDIIKPFAGLLIDAPCSGLGVVRRHPDIRWRRTPADLRRYQQVQLALLASAARLAAPAGILVYAVCSMEPEENDQVIRDFLAGHEDFKLTDCRSHLPAAAAALVDKQGFFRTCPDQNGLDGFFAARLEKM